MTNETVTVTRPEAGSEAITLDKQPLPFYEKVGDYRIKKILGQGGFGFVYLCFEDKMSRYVAIKEYFPKTYAVRGENGVVIADPAHKNEFQWGLDRFVEEAKNLEKLKDCPNIVKVLTNFEDNGTAYLVMALIDGKQTFSDYFSRPENRTEKNVVAMIEPLLATLKAVHDTGFIHRDIKPSNILLKDDGTPVLIDFGSARQLYSSRPDHWTEIGTVGYRAVEQNVKSADRNEGAWTDIFGLGSTLYYAIVGKHPVDSAARLHTTRKLRLQDPYQPILVRGKGVVSDQILTAIDWALCLDEGQRPQSISDWREAMNHKSVRRAPRRSRPLFRYALTVLIVAFIGIGAYVYQANQSLIVDRNPFGLSIEAQKAEYRVGDELQFDVQVETACHFLVFTIDAGKDVQWYRPAGQAAYMGNSALRSGERRTIPVDVATGAARVDPPIGKQQLGSICTAVAIDQATIESLQTALETQNSVNVGEIRAEISRHLTDSEFSIAVTDLLVVE